MFTYALVMDEAEPPLVGFNNGVAATRLYLGYISAISRTHLRHISNPSRLDLARWLQQHGAAFAPRKERSLDAPSWPLRGASPQVGFSERHAWYYYPHMRHEEALLFYTYDGTAPLEGPRFVFHTALGDTGGGGEAAAPPRRSIECRCLVLFS